MKKKVEQKFLPSFELNATPEELEEAKRIINNTPEMKITLKRRKKDLVSKTTTSLHVVEDMFMSEQKGKGNAKATEAYYERTFKKLYYFLYYHFALDTKNEEYIKILDCDVPDGETQETFFGKLLPIVVLEMDDIDSEFREFLSDYEEVSPITVNSYMVGYRVIMYYLMDNGFIEKRKIPIRTVESPIKNTYTDKEKQKLLASPNKDNFSEYRNWVIINWFLATGNRVASVCNVKVGDIDLENGYANINKQKNKKPIQIGIASKLKNILWEYIMEYRTDKQGNILYNQYLFCNNKGEKLTEQGLKKAIATYNKSHGVLKTSCHLFRHTFAKDWIMAGGDLFTLQSTLGHSSTKMVEHYANIYKSDAKKKIDEYSSLAQIKTKGGKTLKRRKFY